MTDCRCGGHGMVQVSAAWVEKRMELFEAELAERRVAALAAGQSVGSPEEMARVIAERRRGLEDSWYPCRVHRPKAFYRYVKGCWEQGHDASECDACQDDAEKSPARRRRRAS